VAATGWPDFQNIDAEALDMNKIQQRDKMQLTSLAELRNKLGAHTRHHHRSSLRSIAAAVACAGSQSIDAAALR